MDRQTYQMEYDFSGGQNELIFPPGTLPAQIYSETAFYLDVFAKLDGDDFDFSNLILAKIFIKPQDTTLLKTDIGDGVDMGSGQIRFTVDKDKIPSSFAKYNDDNNEAPITIWFVIESSDGVKLSLEDGIRVMDIERDGTENNSALEAQGIGYTPALTYPWSRIGSVPSTVESALDTLALPDRYDWGRVIDKDLTDPPGSPLEGDRYIVASAATGDWAGQEDNIAEWDGSTWQFRAPYDGMKVYIIDENTYYKNFTGSWVNDASITVHSGLTGLLADDHTQYSLVDGTRNYTGEVGGIAAVAGASFPTLDQMNAAIAAALAGFTNKGTVETRAVNPPVHSPGLRVLVDANLGAPTGDFVGHDDAIANSDGATWTFEEPPVEGWTVWVDDEDSQYTYDDDGMGWFKSATGESNTAANVGGGAEVFRDKVGVILNLRSNVGGAGIAITQNANDNTYDLDIGSLPAQATPTTGMKIPIDNAGTQEQFDFSLLPAGNTAANVGTGQGLWRDTVGPTINLYSLISSNAAVTWDLSGNDVRLNIGDSGEATKGIVELADLTETDAGSSVSLAVNPNRLNTLYRRKKVVPNNQTGTTYTLLSTDFSGAKTVFLKNVAPIAVTLETNANQAAAVDETVEMIQEDVGVVTVTAVAGVFLNGVDGGTAVFNNPFQGVVLINRGVDQWVALGDYT